MYLILELNSTKCKLFTVAYFSVRSSRSRALRYGQPSWFYTCVPRGQASGFIAVGEGRRKNLFLASFQTVPHPLSRFGTLQDAQSAVLCSKLAHGLKAQKRILAFIRFSKVLVFDGPGRLFYFMPCLHSKWRFYYFWKLSDKVSKWTC